MPDALCGVRPSPPSWCGTLRRTFLIFESQDDAEKKVKNPQHTAFRIVV